MDSRYTYAPQIEPLQVGLDATPRRAPDQFGLNAELPLFDGFQRWNNLKSARTLSEAGRFITLGQRQQVLLDTAIAYIAVLRDGRILAAREAQVAAIRRIHEATARQFEFNDATRTDVALTLSRVQEAEAARERARIDLAAARLELKRLTRIEPERMVPPRLPDRLPRSEDAYADLVLANNPALAAPGSTPNRRRSRRRPASARCCRGSISSSAIWRSRATARRSTASPTRRPASSRGCRSTNPAPSRGSRRPRRWPASAATRCRTRS